MVLERIRAFSRSLPTDEDFGAFVKSVVAGGIDVAEAATTSFVPGGPSSTAQAANLASFKELVLVGQELIRGQTPGLTAITGGRLEGISFTAGQLLVDAGGASDLDEGIVIFHDAISRDKPSLRKILRKSDEKAGRIERVKATKAQRATRLAVQAGMVKRNKLGQITGLTLAAQQKIKRLQSSTKAATRKALIKKQQRFASRLRRLK